MKTLRTRAARAFGQFGLGGMLWLAGCGGAVGQTNSAPPTSWQYRTIPVAPSANPAEKLQRAQQQLQYLSGAAPAQAARAHTGVAEALFELRRYDQALQHGRQAQQLYQRTNQVAEQLRTLRLVGRVQYAQGDTGQARQTFLRLLRHEKKQGSASGQAQAYEHLGDLYASEQAWAQAQYSYERAYGEWQRVGDPRRAAVALHAIGRMHFAQKHFSRALYYLRLGTQQAKQLADSIGVGHVLLSTGDVYAAVGNHDVALGFYTQALEFVPRRNPSPALQATAHRALAAAYDSLGNPAAAARSLRRALPYARHNGSISEISKDYRSLAGLYGKQGQHAQALQALTRYVGLQDSSAAEQRAAQVEELRTRYETEKKEREIALLTKDREIQEAQLRRQGLARNVLAAGSLLLFLVVVALVKGRTEQRRVNRLLQRKNAAISRQKEELDRLNRTKDTLFSVISHDLRSPLSSLYSLLALLRIGSLPAERLAAHSERLTRTLDTTLHLLDNLLNWAATQMKGTTVRPETVRLHAVVEECVALLLGDAERKEIEVINCVGEPCYARADLNMTRLIVRNLLSNAIKFTPAGGTVWVSAIRQGPAWEVSIRDTGVGIAAADQGKIFGEAEPHSTLGTAREKGVGLGLRLCLDFVQRNGGHIWFSSEPGRGSTFRFTLKALDLPQTEVVRTNPTERELPGAAPTPGQRASVGAE
ncbi:tetratricopeptide repeat-containing sensor histidine kinase [Hymenobacter koreensis]|uniref:histidine kinase n=1 Tax=Hymenobacter koreensis TaxID=1084523 RepID=A0ABP8IZC7_9BACT